MSYNDVGHRPSTRSRDTVFSRVGRQSSVFSRVGRAGRAGRAGLRVVGCVGFDDAMTRWMTYHEREDDGDDLDRLDGPEDRETHHLDRREHVHAPQRHRTQEHVVRLVLGRHEDDHDALQQLQGAAATTWSALAAATAAGGATTW